MNCYLSKIKKITGTFCIAAIIGLFFACAMTGTADESYSSVSVNIFDSVGGTLITEPTTLTVYKTGTQIPFYRFIVYNGKTIFGLRKGECYDLYLSGEKNKLAESVIENYCVKDTDTQTVMMIQREIQKGAEPKAPAVTSVKLNGENFTDGSVWKSTMYQQMKLEIVFKAPSRPVAATNGGNFGCAIAVGFSPSSQNNIASVSPICKRENDGSWTCTAAFTFDRISFPSEINDLIITAYDVAGNRVERHINSIEFRERRVGLTTTQNATIKNFRVEMHRFPHSLGLFNLSERQTVRPFAIEGRNGESNTHEALLWFRIKDFSSNDLSIRGFDIYRRKQGERTWIHVGRRQYANDYTGEQDIRYPSYKGFHIGYDTDVSLEENVTYEYKISAFTDSTHRVDSPIATARLLPANTIRLESPADNGSVKFSELDNLRLSFRLTNRDIWEKGYADFFTFGLVIADKTTAENVVFAGKVSVDLKKPQGERLTLKFARGNQFLDLTLAELKQRGFIGYAVTEDDLVSYNDGVVTLQPAYLRTPGFCHPKYQANKFRKGYTYGWDIFDWGKDAVRTTDDEPAAFTSVWRCKDNDGNEIAPPTEDLSSSESFANRLSVAGSLNGQYYFKITDE